jgi:hypothetical protein
MNNFENENDVWLDRLVPKPPARKCGHCHKTGHTVWDCEEVHMLWDRLYMEMVIKLEDDPLGYKFENFIESLTGPYLKIVYKMMCKKTMKKKEVSVYEEIFEAFRVLNPVYPGKIARRVRSYENAYRATQQDVATGQNGRGLQTHLLSLSIYERRELAIKVSGDHNDWIGCFTYNQVFTDAAVNRIRLNGRIENTSLHIHCHFSEMGLGYHFSIVEFVQHAPVRNQYHITTLLDTRYRFLKMDKMRDNRVVFSKTVTLEKKWLTREVHKDCAVCMETKCDAQHVSFNCNHEFCGSCVGHMMEGAMKGSRDIVCPLCRTSVSKIVYVEKKMLAEMRELIVA